MTSKTKEIPNWAPVATLAALVCVGLVGFVGAGRSTQPPVEASTPPGKQLGPTIQLAAPEAATSVEPSNQKKRATLPADVALPTRGVTLEKMGGKAIPDEVEARHILVQYDGSWKRDSDEPVLREEAKKLAEQALAELRRGESFESVLGKYCNSGSERSEQGKLPPLQKDQTMTAIANAVFPLKVGEYSEVSESVFGYHVFQRTK